jgi:hypothetical protein
MCHADPVFFITTGITAMNYSTAMDHVRELAQLAEGLATTINTADNGHAALAVAGLRLAAETLERAAQALDAADIAELVEADRRAALAA